MLNSAQHCQGVCDIRGTAPLILTRYWMEVSG